MIDKLEIIGADKLKELLDYDYENGCLIWRKRHSGSMSDKVFNKRFSGKKAGNKTKRTKRNRESYIVLSIYGKMYSAHRVIWYMVYGELPESIDHIDGNGLNNKIENLRNSTVSEQSRNYPLSKSNKTGILGVYFDMQRSRYR